ncbi:MAG: carboxypeptidase regulatory-like domain-containing protein [Chitinophagales bacterium]|nr:carboxypeptidase regulatory-like domain-containing protein [Chitinophagales bacterium]
MATERIIPKYRCKQTELYAVVTAYIVSLTENLPAFTAHNTMYNPVNLAAFQAQLDAAKALPNFQQRNEPSETLRVLIKEQAEKSINKWRALRTYIERSFPPALIKPKLEAAGWSYLAQANAFNWEEIVELLDSGYEFITANEPALTANGMPPAFPAEYQAEQAAYMAFFNQLSDTTLDQRQQTDEKINANNALYDELIRIGKDANVIFRNNPALLERFTFTKVLALVSSPGPATLKGNVTDVAENPIPDVSVYLQELDLEVFTDATGTYLTGNISSGTYTVTFSKEGFVTQQVQITINPGVDKIYDVTLVTV